MISKCKYLFWTLPMLVSLAAAFALPVPAQAQIVSQCGTTSYVIGPAPSSSGGSKTCSECDGKKVPYAISISQFSETHRKCLEENGCVIQCTVKSDCTFCDALQIVKNVSSLIMRFMGGVAAIFFIYAGVLFIVNFGNSEKIQHARSLLINTVIGIVVILFSWTAVNVGIAILTSAPGKRSSIGSVLGKAWNQPLDCQPQTTQATCPVSAP